MSERKVKNMSGVSEENVRVRLSEPCSQICQNHDAMEPAADSEAQGPEAEWRTLSKPSAAMAQKVAAFEKSGSGFKLAPEQLSACRWFAEAMDVALQAFAKPHAACVSFDWRGWHWKDYYHFRTHAGCFLSFFSGQTWRRRAIHDFHL